MSLDDSRVHLIDSKLDCLENFLRVTCEERKAIKANNIEDLGKVLKKKQSIIARVDYLDKEIKKKKVSVPTDFAQLTRDFFSELASFHRGNEKLLADKMVQARKEIVEFRNQKKVRQVYKGNLPSNLSPSDKR